ncbi:uncharacterized protein LOC109829200 isoform X1 [Asparagus officinalis]|uniref:uncharacterized protein LOC109829200 isoform X1 n=1 Tax=Asparagus officinalis TaxID=4686 RepID=UPI00098E1422|nr:uncharacterized protein LOC109829200 isoform X1 [Asparagus officinalis]
MTAAARRKPRGGGDVMDSIYSVVALVLILVACVELGDAATTVEVYRLIQYDIAGSPFGSRLSALNHHAGASPFDSGVNLSRTVLILPVRDLNLTSLKGRTRLRPRLRPPLAPRPLRDRAAWLMRGKDRFVDSVAENLLDRLQTFAAPFTKRGLLLKFLILRGGSLLAYLSSTASGDILPIKRGTQLPPKL